MGSGSCLRQSLPSGPSARSKPRQCYASTQLAAANHFHSIGVACDAGDSFPRPPIAQLAGCPPPVRAGGSTPALRAPGRGDGQGDQPDHLDALADRQHQRAPTWTAHDDRVTCVRRAGYARPRSSPGPGCANARNGNHSSLSSRMLPAAPDCHASVLARRPASRRGWRRGCGDGSPRRALGAGRRRVGGVRFGALVLACLAAGARPPFATRAPPRSPVIL